MEITREEASVLHDYTEGIVQFNAKKQEKQRGIATLTNTNQRYFNRKSYTLV